MNTKRLQQLAGIKLNENYMDSASDTAGQIEEASNHVQFILKELTQLHRTLQDGGHTASAASISNIIGGMQQNYDLFSSAVNDLGK